MAQVPNDEESTAYRPSPTQDETGERRPIGYRAIVIGVLVDWSATMASTAVIMFMASIVAASRYQTKSQLEEFAEKLSNAPDFVLLMTLVNLGCVAVGGFVAGVIATRDERRHALWMGVVSMSVGLIVDGSVGVSPTGWYPEWLRFVSHALVVPAALLGGAAAAARNADAGNPDEAGE